MPVFTPQQINPEEGGTLCDTLGKAECEFVAAMIIRWHHTNNHTSWQPLSRRDLVSLLDKDEMTKAWAQNPFWRPSPYDFAQKGFIEGWDKDPDSKGTLTDKFFEKIAKKVRA
jgi:hypothetical protein